MFKQIVKNLKISSKMNVFSGRINLNQVFNTIKYPYTKIFYNFFLCLFRLRWLSDGNTSQVIKYQTELSDW